jgi:hypothetical protein
MERDHSEDREVDERMLSQLMLGELSRDVEWIQLAQDRDLWRAFVNVLMNFGVLPWRLVADLSPRRPGFAPRSIHVGFIVDIVSLGQVFLRVIRVFPVSIIPPSLSSSYHLGMNKMSVRGSSSET